MTTILAPTTTATIDTERAFDFLRINPRSGKPRHEGLTEIRGLYYSVMGPRYLADVLETMGVYVDALKFAGGSFTLMPRRQLRELIELCHRHEVAVSTGGFIERVLSREPTPWTAISGNAATWALISSRSRAASSPCRPTTGCGSWSAPRRRGSRPSPKSASSSAPAAPRGAEKLEQGGTRDADWAIRLARRFLDAGAYLIMIESEGITENVKRWRTDVAARIVDALGIERVMFEAAEPDVFAWYVKNYRPEVNLFVDHSQIVHLECLRAGIWGTADLWGKVVTYKE